MSRATSDEGPPNMFSALDVSTSGLAAQRVRMNAISGNLANISTTHNEEGEAVPYQPRFVVFQTDESVGSNGAAGVRVESVADRRSRAALQVRAAAPGRDQGRPVEGLRGVSKREHDDGVYRRHGGRQGL